MQKFNVHKNLYAGTFMEATCTTCHKGRLTSIFLCQRCPEGRYIGRGGTFPFGDHVREMPAESSKTFHSIAFYFKPQKITWSIYAKIYQKNKRM
jgi:hypothetical protein